MRTDIAQQLEDALNRLMLPRHRGALCAPVIAAAPEGIDAQTYPLLGALARIGPTTAARLAEEIGIDRSGASRYADRLVGLGFVARSADPDDGRATQLTLTTGGAELMQRLDATLADHMHERIAGWPRGRAEALVDGLEALLDGTAPSVRYDRIGVHYAETRREDPRLAAHIRAALGDARTVVNVGAGTGSYEPRDRQVIAIEPSDVMAAQRPAELAPAIRGTAAALPLRDGAVDAAMAVLSLHHWDEARERGVRELRRVSRGPVVIVTFDPVIAAEMWLAAEYLPEVAALDAAIFPPTDEIAGWLGGDVHTEVVPIPATTPDWTFASFWAHPERVLDPAARAATSGFARTDPAVVARAVDALSADLRSGAWDRRHGELRTRAEYDAGLRLLVAR